MKKNQLLLVLLLCSAFIVYSQEDLNTITIKDKLEKELNLASWFITSDNLKDAKKCIDKAKLLAEGNSQYNELINEFDEFYEYVSGASITKEKDEIVNNKYYKYIILCMRFAEDIETSGSFDGDSVLKKDIENFIETTKYSRGYTLLAQYLSALPIELIRLGANKFKSSAEVEGRKKIELSLLKKAAELYDYEAKFLIAQRTDNPIQKQKLLEECIVMKVPRAKYSLAITYIEKDGSKDSLALKYFSDYFKDVQDIEALPYMIALTDNKKYQNKIKDLFISEIEKIQPSAREFRGWLRILGTEDTFYRMKRYRESTVLLETLFENNKNFFDKNIHLYQKLINYYEFVGDKKKMKFYKKKKPEKYFGK